MAGEEKIVFNGGPFQSYWWADEHEPIHPTVSAELTEPVDAETLRQAWADTLRVYPLLDCVVDDKDEEVVFFAAQGTSEPVCSAVPLCLASAATNFRAASVTYFGSTLTLSVYHSVVDEIGLMEVFKTLLSLYVARRTHTAPDPSCAMLQEGRSPQSYFVQSTMLEPSGYRPVPLLLYKDIRRVFHDETADENDANVRTSALVEADAVAFDALCKRRGVNADELFAFVVATAVCAMHPHDDRDLSLAFNTDFRGTFGVRGSIAPCSRRMPVVVTRQDMASDDPFAALDKIAATRRHQKKVDYVKSHVAMENTYAVLNLRNPCLSINYVDGTGFSGLSSQVARVSMHDYSLRSAFVLGIEERLLISLQYGRATAKYAAAIARVLRELGVDARVDVEPHTIPGESNAPVTSPKDGDHEQ